MGGGWHPDEISGALNVTSTPRLQQKWWVVFEGGGVGGSNGFSVTAVLLMSPELRRVGEELTLVSAGH